MNISLENIGKKYGENWIFRGMTTDFSQGIYGVTGFNGSGKSTLIQILSGFVTPSEGKIEFNGGKTNVEDVYKSCSIAAPYLELPPEFTVLETVQIQSQFKPFLQNMKSAELIEEIALTTHATKTLSQLSSGMIQRLKLALAIFADSSLLLLDEPTSNLGAKWINWFQSTLAANSSKRTIVIGSNDQTAELSLVNQGQIDLSVFHQ